MSGNSKLAIVQDLRGIAALAVVISHAMSLVQSYSVKYGIADSRLNQFYHLNAVGTAGVDIFFVTSGFIMVYITRNKSAGLDAAGDFLVHRYKRIYPLYWLVTLALAAVYVIMPSSLHRDVQVDTRFLQSSFLLFGSENSMGDFSPLVPVAWTLAYEIFFYNLFALGLIGFLNRGRSWFVALAFAGFMGLRSLGFNQGFAGNSLVLEFVYGIAIANLYSQRKSLPQWLTRISLVGAVVGFGALTYFGYIDVVPLRGFQAGLPAAALVIAFLFNPAQKSLPWLNKLGDASYSLYLTHFLVQVAIGRVWVKIPFLLAAPPELLILVLIAASVIVALMCYRWIESPLIARQSRTKV